jgi:hypothetical protein
VLLLAAALGLGVWYATYPETSDPKNIRYVLWKIGLPTLDPDTATGTMIGDGTRDRLVLGKSRRQLQGRFGYLVTSSEASPYLRKCSGTFAASDILFIRRSPWMVIFDGEKATELVLIKGC